MSHAALPVFRNRILSGLSSDIQATLYPKMRPFSLAVRAVLVAPNSQIDAVYFVESGWVSLVSTLEDGSQAEVGVVGREGMVGMPLIMGVDTSYEESFVQAEGTALRMEARAFRQALQEIPEFQQRLFLYSEAMRAQITQTAACNGQHALEQRLARWLLMARDRCDGDDLPVTQEFLAMMLCVYRPSITVLAGILQRAGIIRYGRGHITILDRDALEATACDCFESVKRRFDQLLG